MNVKRIVRWLAVALATAALLASTGCIAVKTVERKDRTERVEIDLEGADAAEVDIDMGFGQLLVQGGAVGAGGLMDAEFEYSIDSWKPRVTYNEYGGTGELQVQQPSTHFSAGDSRYVWDITLTDDVPLYLAVDMGAGQAALDLTRVDLRELALGMGAGDTTVDLRGRYTHDVEALLEGGAGAITVQLPDDIGVRVSVDQGIGEIIANGFTLRDGDYVNDAYDDADVVIEVDIDAGVGQVILALDE